LALKDKVYSVSSASASSSSAPTSSGSALKSTSSDGSNSSSCGAKTTANVVSSSSKYSYKSDSGKSATDKLSPISNSSTLTTISSGISRGFTRICNSYNGCCKIPPSRTPDGSPSRRNGTSTSISSVKSTM